MKKINTLVGEKIRTYRKSVGLTLEEFAKSINLSSPGQISGWERNLHLPSLPSILKIKEVHGLDLTFNVKDGYSNAYGDDPKLMEINKNYDSQKIIPRSDQQLFGLLNENGEIKNQFYVPRDFLRIIKLDYILAEILIITAIGNSMAPDIQENETLLLDPNSSPIIDGATYVFKINNSINIRRLEQDDKNIWLIPQNPTYDKKKVPSSDIKIIGRVLKKLPSYPDV